MDHPVLLGRTRRQVREHGRKDAARGRVEDPMTPPARRHHHDSPCRKRSSRSMQRPSPRDDPIDPKCGIDLAIANDDQSVGIDIIRVPSKPGSPDR